MFFEFDTIPVAKDKIAIITGANSGLGYETAVALSKKGMHVILACRDEFKTEKAIVDIKTSVPDAKLEYMHLDLSRLQSVRDFCSHFNQKYSKLDILVNNAGVMTPPYTKTEEGFELQIGVNYLGHFLLTGLLFDKLKNTAYSRIVHLGSLAHLNATIDVEDLHYEKRAYKKMNAYRQSKLACMLFGIELDRRLKKHQLPSRSILAHPGVSLTNLVRYMPQFLLSILSVTLLPFFTHKPKIAALSQIAAALKPDLKGGEYIGPDGRNEMKGMPHFAKVSDQAKDPELAKQLWSKAEELCQIKYNFNS